MKDLPRLNILFFILIMISVCSCEKAVRVDLNNMDPALVVEANISDRVGNYQVALSKTVNYYAGNRFPVVETGALVVISDDGGQTDTLITSLSGGGYYYTATLKGIPGRTYFLKIKTKDGKTYEASSKMPGPVLIDTILFVPDQSNGTYIVTCQFQDPVGSENYYMLNGNSTKVGTLDTHYIILLDDKLTNGQRMSYTFHAHVWPDDNVTVQLKCIDKTTYDFYKNLAIVGEDLDQFLASPPANPPSNISNGGFGCFSAFSENEMTAKSGK